VSCEEQVGNVIICLVVLILFPFHSYPVHCAVLGGSLSLLKWLVDEHCCPLRSIRISGKTRDSSGSFTPILTSRGRSLLGIAFEKENIDIIRYLVVEKGMPLSGEKEMSMALLITVLDQALRMLPSSELPSHESRSENFPTPYATIPTISTESMPGIPDMNGEPANPPRPTSPTSGAPEAPVDSVVFALDENDSTGSIEDPVRREARAPGRLAWSLINTIRSALSSVLFVIPNRSTAWLRRVVTKFVAISVQLIWTYAQSASLIVSLFVFISHNDNSQLLDLSKTHTNLACNRVVFISSVCIALCAL
jgi:hypothetical protein